MDEYFETFTFSVTRDGDLTDGNSNYVGETVTVSVESGPGLNWTTLVEKFEDFLRAAGYILDGHLELIKVCKM